ncbi:uncharacterized protein [Physcomitrium patens]|uniref:uncharacterized protein isoform X4 n=1 Tax=Physcomitrium patens TaxID=3218 RepID=UPI003CCDABDA
MSQSRKKLSSDSKNDSDQLYENCEPIESGSTSQVSQGTFKSNTASKEPKLNPDNLSNDRRVLLAITVEIEDGCVEHIQLKEGDSAEATAMKFCRDHALPEQFVAPLTEHIVSNIISISKEEGDILFQSQGDSHISNDENSAVHSDAPYSSETHGSNVVDSLPKAQDFGGKPVKAETSALLARREHRSIDRPFMASQKTNRDHGSYQRCIPRDVEGIKARKETRRKKHRKKISERLLAPTITSLAKCGVPVRECRPRICHPRPPSEMMGAQQQAVYMRLYTEHTRHEQRSREEVKRSRAMYQENVVRRRMGLSKRTCRLTRMRGMIAKQYKNYGELLYAEGLNMRQKHMKAVADKQKQDEAKELDGVTLKPKISERAKNIKRAEGHVWSRLQYDDKPKQDQLQELRQEVWKEKLTECTFKPRINSQKKYDDQPQQFGDANYSDRFEQLFLDAENRRRRRAEYMESFPEGVTFQPTINRYLPYWAMMEEDWQFEQSVFRRLLDNAAVLMEKKQLLEQMAHRPLDPRTGRALYTPITGRKPQNRNLGHLPIGEYLYRMKFAFDRKIRILAARDYKMKKERALCRYVGPKSQKLIQRIKERGFKQVFDFLDEDKDGYVDLTTANFDRLNEDVIDELTRMRNTEGGNGGEEKILDFEKFVKLMLVAESKYNCGQQVHQCLKHKLNPDQYNFPFHSEMDQLSRNLATRRRKYRTHHEWVKIIIEEFDKRHQKVEISEDGKCGNNVETISDTNEKAKQEMHGFYIQGDQNGPELLGIPAPLSPPMTSSSSSSRTCVLRTIDTSVSSSRSGRRSSSAPGFDIVAELDDLPTAGNSVARRSMFFSLMGA